MKAGIRRHNILNEETGLIPNVLTDFTMNVAYCVLCSGLY